MLLTLLVLAPLFSTCRRPCSAAVIIDAVVFGMIDVAELRRLHRVARFDFWIAVAAIVGVLSAGVLAGVVDRRRALARLARSTSRPRRAMPLLGREPGTQVFRDLDEHPGDETFPGIAVLRLDGGLFFATAEALEDRVRELVDDGEPHCARSCSTSRASTSSTRRARRSWPRSTSSPRRDGVTLRLARVKPQVRAVLEADGVVERLGADHIHGNVARAVEAQLADAPLRSRPLAARRRPAARCRRGRE